MAKRSIIALCGYLLVFAVSPALSQTETCGGIAGVECGSGQYCDYAETGTCGEGDQQGVCYPTPEVCTSNYEPVCGCDGNIYSNTCIANAAGVSVAPSDVCLTKEAEELDISISGISDEGPDIEVTVCAIKDGQNREYPNSRAAREDGATNIVAQVGGSCPASQ